MQSQRDDWIERASTRIGIAGLACGLFGLGCVGIHLILATVRGLT